MVVERRGDILLQTTRSDAKNRDPCLTSMRGGTSNKLSHRLVQCQSGLNAESIQPFHEDCLGFFVRCVFSDGQTKM